jgi:23S rRNA-/tRNA-specific pseudouridylate synthase
MNTSGVIAAAKDADSARKVHQQFDSKQVTKTYLAVCMGVPQERKFTATALIGQHPTVKIARAVMTAAEGGQPAVTVFQVGFKSS